MDSGIWRRVLRARAARGEDPWGVSGSAGRPGSGGAASGDPAFLRRRGRPRPAPSVSEWMSASVNLLTPWCNKSAGQDTDLYDNT